MGNFELGTVVKTCHHNTKKVETRVSGIQSHLQLCSELKSRQNYIRSCLKKRTEERIKKIMKLTEWGR